MLNRFFTQQPIAKVKLSMATLSLMMTSVLGAMHQEQAQHNNANPSSTAGLPYMGIFIGGAVILGCIGMIVYECSSHRHDADVREEEAAPAPNFHAMV